MHHIILHVYLQLNLSYHAVITIQAGDASSVVRLYVFLGDMGTAESIVAETSDPAATFQLGQQVPLVIQENN